MSTLYAPYSCMDNAGQETARVLAQKISSGLSIMGSGYIIGLTYAKYKKKKSSVDSYQRIMAGYSMFDVVLSFFYWFLGTWMTPKETGWWGAMGNQITCSIQGYFFYFGYGITMYQMLLSLQMVLLVKYLWTPSKFERTIEFRMHKFIAVSAVILGSFPLFFQGYNPECGLCRPVPLPFWCGDWVMGDGETECIRGNEFLAEIFLYIFWVQISMITLFCTVAMVEVYRAVYNQERKISAYKSDQPDGRSSKKRGEARRIRNTLLEYTGSFFLCWIVPMILWYPPHGMPVLHIIADCLFALLGFFNMLTFIKPKCVKYQKDHPGTSLTTAYFCIMFSHPISFVRRFSKGSTQELGSDTLDTDDGIGFGNYNAPTESTYVKEDI